MTFYSLSVIAYFLRMFYALQATSLRGVDVIASVEETVKGALPPFDQGTVGINVMPLGSAEVSMMVPHERSLRAPPPKRDMLLRTNSYCCCRLVGI